MERGERFLAAAREGDLASLGALLAEEPALLSHRNELGQSAILLAQYHRKPEAVRFLRDAAPPLTLHEAAAVGDLETVRRLILERGRLIDAHAGDGFTPLALAAFFGHPEVAAYLVSQGANVSLAAANPMKVTPLHAAVAAGHVKIVETLVENGADVNARQQQGWTPLHGAAQRGDEALVKLLLSHGAQPEMRAESGQTPLDLAMTHGHAGVASLLADSG